MPRSVGVLYSRVPSGATLWIILETREGRDADAFRANGLLDDVTSYLVVATHAEKDELLRRLRVAGFQASANRVPATQAETFAEAIAGLEETYPGLFVRTPPPAPSAAEAEAAALEEFRRNNPPPSVVHRQARPRRRTLRFE